MQETDYTNDAKECTVGKTVGQMKTIRYDRYAKRYVRCWYVGMPKYSDTKVDPYTEEKPQSLDESMEREKNDISQRVCEGSACESEGNHACLYFCAVNSLSLTLTRDGKEAHLFDRTGCHAFHQIVDYPLHIGV